MRHESSGSCAVRARDNKTGFADACTVAAAALQASALGAGCLLNFPFSSLTRSGEFHRPASLWKG